MPTMLRIDTVERALRREAEPRRIARDLREPPPLTDAERADDRNLAKSSVRGGDLRRDAVLALACDLHAAPAGVPCWRSDRSGVRGFCSDRWSRGIAMAPRVVFGQGVAR